MPCVNALHGHELCSGTATVNALHGHELCSGTANVNALHGDELCSGTATVNALHGHELCSGTANVNALHGHELCSGTANVNPLALCCGLTLQVPKLPSLERLRLWQEAPTFVSCGSSKGQAEEAARLLLSRLVGEDGSTPQAGERSGPMAITFSISLPVQDAEDIAETSSGHIFVATKVCGGLTASPLPPAGTAPIR